MQERGRASRRGAESIRAPLRRAGATCHAALPFWQSNVSLWPLGSILTRIYGLSYSREKNAIPLPGDRRYDLMEEDGEKMSRGAPAKWPKVGCLHQKDAAPRVPAEQNPPEPLCRVRFATIHIHPLLWRGDIPSPQPPARFALIAQRLAEIYDPL